MSISLYKYKNASNTDLEKLSTGALMKLRKLSFKHAHCDCCGEVIDEDQHYFNLWVTNLNNRVTTILKTRPHYPTKTERKFARQESARRRG